MKTKVTVLWEKLNLCTWKSWTWLSGICGMIWGLFVINFFVTWINDRTESSSTTMYQKDLDFMAFLMEIFTKPQKKKIV